MKIAERFSKTRGARSREETYITTVLEFAQRVSEKS
jgi:hypothetical protein